LETPTIKHGLNTAYAAYANMYKRRRSYGPTRPKRPVDKVVINETGVATNTQSNNNIYAAPVACTYTGGRITGAINNVPGTAARVTLCLVHVRQGTATGTISLTDGSSTYTPEQNILWATTVYGTSAGATYIPIDVVIKTKRKMLTGDQIILAYLSDQPSACYIGLIVTAFIKQ